MGTSHPLPKVDHLIVVICLPLHWVSLPEKTTVIDVTIVNHDVDDCNHQSHCCYRHYGGCCCYFFVLLWVFEHDDVHRCCYRCYHGHGHDCYCYVIDYHVGHLQDKTIHRIKKESRLDWTGALGIVHLPKEMIRLGD